MQTITFPCSLPRDGVEIEIEVQVQGTYYPARSAAPPRYDCGGEPPEPATFKVDEVCVDGEVATEALEQEIEDALRQTIGAVCLERMQE